MYRVWRRPDVGKRTAPRDFNLKLQIPSREMEPRGLGAAGRWADIRDTSWDQAKPVAGETVIVASLDHGT